MSWRWAETKGVRRARKREVVIVVEIMLAVDWRKWVNEWVLGKGEN